MKPTNQRCPHCVGNFLKGNTTCPSCSRELRGLDAVSARTAGPRVDVEAIYLRMEERLSEAAERFFTSGKENPLEALSRWNHPIVLASVVLAVLSVLVSARLGIG